MIAGKQDFFKRTSVFLVAVAILFCSGINTLQAQAPPPTPSGIDPGPRPGPQPGIGAGNPIPGLPGDQVTFWFAGLNLFCETFSVTGSINAEPLRRSSHL